MAVIRVNGIDVYYEQAGQGPRVLFISGTGGDLRNKPNQFDSPLTQSFTLLSYDQRGLGQSGKPATDYSMGDYAEDAAALLDALGWGPVPVIGVSFGGMVAQELALRHPHLVSALALACTSSGGAGGASFPLHELAELAPDERARRHIAQSDLRRDASWQQANPERFAKLLEMARAAERPDKDMAGAARQLQARAGHDTYARLPQLQMPVGLFAGRYDGIAPPSNQEAMAKQIDDARLHWFEGGHLFMVQDKSAYPALIQWIQSALN